MVSQAYEDLGVKLMEQGDDARGELALIRALQYQPSSVPPRVQLALFYDRSGDMGNAARQYRQILKVQPDHLPARNNLAWILATAPDAEIRQPMEAERLAREVCRATEYKLAEPLDTLAAAQAASNKFAEAMATIQRGLDIAEKSDQANVVKKLRQRLALYEKRMPFIDTRPSN